MEKLLFTSESVTEGHPDKMCDQISDAVLDALLEQDPMSRVACETCTTTGLVLVMGEITTKAYVDIQKIVRETVREIGYTKINLVLTQIPAACSRQLTNSLWILHLEWIKRWKQKRIRCQTMRSKQSAQATRE